MSLFSLGPYFQNLLLYSQEYDNAIWAPVTASLYPHSGTAPDGSNNAYKLSSNALGSHEYIITPIDSWTSGAKTFNHSVITKDIDAGYIVIYIRNFTVNELLGVRFTYENGVPVFDSIVDNTACTLNSVSIIAMANGWFNVGMNVTFTTSPIPTDDFHIRIFVTWLEVPAVAQSLLIAGSSVSEDSEFTPYIKTEATALTDVSVFVDIDPEFDLKDGGAKIEDILRSTTGTQERYLWGDYEKFQFKVKQAPINVKENINSWWLTNTDLVFSMTITSETFEVHITNKTIPINKYSAPYTSIFDGDITLETF